MNLFSTIIHFGVTSDMPSEDRKYIRLSNILNLAIIFIISLPGILSTLKNPYPFNGQNGMIRFELLIIGALLNLYLNKKGYVRWVKIQTIIFPIFFINIFPLLNNFVHAGQLLWMPYATIALGSFAFCLFSYSKDRNLLLFLVISIGLLSITFDNLFVYFSPNELDLSFIYKYYVPYKSALTVICILLYFVFFVLKRSNYQILKELDKKNELLYNLNENLEQQVQARTKRINAQSDRIKELAFTNSHQLRSSVVRIIGLSHILKSGTATEEEKAYCIQNIEDSVKEMDDITRNLSINLIEEE
jgi:signal transduction histidine kinase